MLTLTENASDIVKAITNDLPGEAGGLRIASASPAGEDFAVTATETPEDGDQVVEYDGAVVFLEAVAAQALDAMVLDARVDESGAVEFGLGQQPTE